MCDEKPVSLYVEMWKQTIEVQKHFNDIEMRVRALALTVLTFTLGAAAFAIREGTLVLAFGRSVHFASIILLVGMTLWLTFYFVDQAWYHRLLIGAVKHGEDLELEIAKILPAAGLTRSISKSSPYTMTLGFGSRALKFDVHSTAKIRIFYWSVSSILLGSAIGVQFGL